MLVKFEKKNIVIHMLKWIGYSVKNEYVLRGGKVNRIGSDLPFEWMNMKVNNCLSNLLRNAYL